MRYELSTKNGRTWDLQELIFAENDEAAMVFAERAINQRAMMMMKIGVALLQDNRIVKRYK